jgi:hypothetical protein
MRVFQALTPSRSNKSKFDFKEEEINNGETV